MTEGAHPVIDRGWLAQMGARRPQQRPPTGGQMTMMSALRNALLELGFGRARDETLVYGASFSPSGQLPPHRRLIVDVYYSSAVDFVTYAQLVWLTADTQRQGTMLCTLEGRTPSDAARALEENVLRIVEVLRDLEKGSGVAQRQQEEN